MDAPAASSQRTTIRRLTDGAVPPAAYMKEALKRSPGRAS